MSQQKVISPSQYRQALKINIKAAIKIAIILLLSIAFHADAQGKYQSKRPSYYNRSTGTIIDYDFFDSIIKYLPHNKRYKRNKTTCIDLSFGSRSKSGSNLIGFLDEKEQFNYPYFVLVIPHEGFVSYCSDDVVVNYKGFIFVVEDVAESILVKRGPQKRFKERLDNRPLFGNDIQYIKFEDGNAEEMNYDELIRNGSIE